jgi:hypothetical protein
MPDPMFLRQHAARCAAVAEIITVPDVRAELLDMAGDFLRWANELDAIEPLPTANDVAHKSSTA